MGMQDSAAQAGLSWRRQGDRRSLTLGLPSLSRATVTIAVAGGEASPYRSAQHHGPTPPGTRLTVPPTSAVGSGTESSEMGWVAGAPCRLSRQRDSNHSAE